MDRVRPSQRIGRHLRQLDVAHFPGGHHVRQDADAALERHVYVRPMQVIQVDGPGTQALQRLVERALERLRPPSDDALAIDAGDVAPAREVNPIAVWGRHFAE